MSCHTCNTRKVQKEVDAFQEVPSERVFDGLRCACRITEQFDTTARRTENDSASGSYPLLCVLSFCVSRGLDFGGCLLLFHNILRMHKKCLRDAWQQSETICVPGL